MKRKEWLLERELLRFAILIHVMHYALQLNSLQHTFAFALGRYYINRFLITVISTFITKCYSQKHTQLGDNHCALESSPESPNYRDNSTIKLFYKFTFLRRKDEQENNEKWWEDDETWSKMEKDFSFLENGKREIPK